FQETDTFLRLHYWSRLQKREVPDPEPKHYFEEYGLTWEHLDHFFQSFLEKELGITSLDEMLPTKINLGGKRDLPVHYPYGLEAYVEAPIQDFYSVTQTPTIMRGQ